MIAGMIEWPRKSALAWFEIHDHDTREVIYEPDMDEIQDACNRYDLDYDMIAEAIATKAGTISGFLIVAEKHREFLQKEEA